MSSMFEGRFRKIANSLKHESGHKWIAALAAWSYFTETHLRKIPTTCGERDNNAGKRLMKKLLRWWCQRWQCEGVAAIGGGARHTGDEALSGSLSLSSNQAKCSKHTHTNTQRKDTWLHSDLIEAFSKVAPSPPTKPSQVPQTHTQPHRYTQI